MDYVLATISTSSLSEERSKPWTVILAVAWLGLVLAGTLVLMAYANSPGKTEQPPTHWPVGSSILHDSSRPTLIMFMHPHCPCSKASVGELALLMAHCQGRVNASVLFLRPAEMTNGWVITSTWKEASRIPGITVQQDDEGREARLFHADTSGDTVLYNSHGDLLFHGGITISRGHSGDNPGRSSLEALLFGQSTAVSNTPTFGCSLFECSMTNTP